MIVCQDFDADDFKSSVETDQRDGRGRRNTLFPGMNPTGTAAMPLLSEMAGLQPSDGPMVTGCTANDGLSDQPTVPEGANMPSPRRPVPRALRSVKAGLQPEQTRYWG